MRSQIDSQFSGSNIFGNEISDSHEFTGSLSITGSLYATASYSTSASWAPTIPYITGSGVNTQISVFSASNGISGSDNLVWDGSKLQLSGSINFNDDTKYISIADAKVIQFSGSNALMGYGGMTYMSSSTVGNMAIGYQAGYSLTGGQWNTFIGYQSGFNLKGGDGGWGYRNIFIGYQSGYKAAAEFGAVGGTNFSDAVIIGAYAGYNITYTVGSVIIGSYAAQNSTTTAPSVAIGSSAGKVNAGVGNIFIGTNAGIKNTTGAYNTFIGNSVGANNVTGSSNTLIGTDAGLGLNGGIENVALGMYTARSCLNDTSYQYNTMLGSRAGGGQGTTMRNSYSTFVGSWAGTYAPYQTYSIFLGFYAGRNASSGSGNIYIGTSTGYYNSGSANVFIGCGIQSTVNNSLNNIAIMGSSTYPLYTFYFGQDIVTTTPVSTKFKISDSSGTNITGSDFIIESGLSTGTQLGGDIIFKSSLSGSSGTTLNSSQEIGRLSAQASGTLYVGTGSNYVEISPELGIRLHGSASCWDDLRISGLNVQTVGVSDPSLIQFLDDGGGSNGVWLYSFTDSRDNQVFLAIQMPHAWKEGTNIHPHVHWAPSDDQPGNVVWGMEYTWQNINDVFPSTTIATPIVIATPEIANYHMMSEFAEIDGTGKTLGSMLFIRLYRDISGGSDTYANGVFLLEFDLHYEIDSLGGKLEDIK